ncbi:MAG: hypothetical protein LBQ09_04300, partial [Acidobacteriaceae bacterium]|nr:hypothetical protein [Acidobacteriaceae bacterium]
MGIIRADWESGQILTEGLRAADHRRWDEGVGLDGGATDTAGGGAGENAGGYMVTQVARQSGWPMRGSRLRGVLCALVASLGLVSGVAEAQTTCTVAPGASLTTCLPAGSGDTWLLQGTASLATPGLTLPPMTIDGGAGGSILTLNNGAGTYGWLTTGGPTTLNLSNLTFTGGNNPAAGAAISVGADLNIVINPGASLSFDHNDSYTGAVYTAGSSLTMGSGTATPAALISFTNNTAGLLGGAIGSSLSVDLTAASIVLSGNTVTGGVLARGAGGAIFSSGGTITLTGAVTMSDNTAVGGTNGNGGGIYTEGAGVVVNGSLTANNNRALNGGAGGAIYTVAGGITVTGSVDVEGNYASTDGGAFRSAQGVTLGLAGGDVTLKNNISTAYGGAIYTPTGVIADIIIGNGTGAITITGNKSGADAGGNLIYNGYVGGGLMT